MKRILAVLALAALLLTGCVRIPDSGPVMPADPSNTPDRSGVEFIAEPPSDDASPEAIILGFLFAGVSPDDDYGVAREFLTDAAANSWNPSAAVMVRSGQPQVSMTGEATSEVAVTLTSRVDARGVMHNEEASTTVLPFSLVQVDSQWRISQAPDGILVSSFHFERLFRSLAVQWYTTDGEQFVPDQRWFPNDPTQVTSRTVDALLGGPAAWLESSVVSAAAPGTVVVGGIADRPGGGVAITISSARPGAVTSQELSRFALQVQRSLSGTGTGVVEVRVAGADDVRGLSTDAVSPATDTLWPRPLMFDGEELRVAESNGALITGMGERLSEIEATSYTLQPGSANPRMGAAHASGSVVWFDDGDMQEIADNVATDPSMDRFGSIWWADDGTDQRVTAWFEGLPQDFTLDITGERVSAVEVSPEGARLAVVTSAQGATVVRLFGIVRVAGAPAQLVAGPSIVPTGGRAVDVVWNSFESLALVTMEDGVSQVRTLGLDGTVNDLTAPPANVIDVAASTGGGAVLGLTESGQLYSMATGRIVPFTGVTDGRFLTG